MLVDHNTWLINIYNTDWWFGTFLMNFHILGIISSTYPTFIFFRGVGLNHQPVLFVSLFWGHWKIPMKHLQPSVSDLRCWNLWEIFRILTWRYLPYIRPIAQAYVTGYPPKIWPKNMVLTYLHLLDPGIPIDEMPRLWQPHEYEKLELYGWAFPVTRGQRWKTTDFFAAEIAGWSDWIDVEVS